MKVIWRGRVTNVAFDGEQMRLTLLVKDLDTNLTLNLEVPGADTTLRKGEILDFAFDPDPAHPFISLQRPLNALHHGSAVGDAMWKHKMEDWEYRCAKCLRQFKAEELTRGHLLPKSKQGIKTAGNLVPLCKTCNLEDENALCWYELITPEKHLRPDDETRILLMREARASGEEILRKVAFTFDPRGKQVEIVADITQLRFNIPEAVGVALTSQTGHMLTIEDTTGDLFIALDSPAHVRLPDGKETDVSELIARTDQVAFVHRGQNSEEIA